jgi:predicted component of type VI protein secretion system
MRVVIEVVAGPLAGRKFHLVRNQRLEVGGTAQADVCVRGDNQMAPQQFALETDHEVCRVRDISRRGNTLVNGQAVESAVLADGDEILAGASRFIIHVEGAAASVPAQVVAAKPAPAAIAAAARKPGSATYEAVACDTGLTRYSGLVSQFPPAALASALAAQSPLYLLADNRRLRDEVLAALPNPHYLFDWLGPSAAQVSPLVLQPGEVADPAGLIERGWRKDGLVCFFAKEAGDAAHQALAKGARAGEDRVVGICWPSILAYLLAHYQPEFVKQLTEPFACVLLEDPMAADHWQIFSAEPLSERLESLGFHPLAAETK